MELSQCFNLKSNLQHVSDLPLSRILSPLFFFFFSLPYFQDGATQDLAKLQTFLTTAGLPHTYEPLVDFGVESLGDLLNPLLVNESALRSGLGLSSADVDRMLLVQTAAMKGEPLPPASTASAVAAAAAAKKSTPTARSSSGVDSSQAATNATSLSENGSQALLAGAPTAGATPEVTGADAPADSAASISSSSCAPSPAVSSSFVVGDTVTWKVCAVNGKGKLRGFLYFFYLIFFCLMQ